jgi:WD40 repeat protein
VRLHVLTQIKKRRITGGSPNAYYDLVRLRKDLPDESISAEVSDFRCYALAFHPKKQQLAVATKGNAVVVFAYQHDKRTMALTLEKVHTLKTDNDVNGLAFSADGAALYFVDDDGFLHTVLLEFNRPKRYKYKASEKYIRTIDIHPSEPIIALAGDDNKIQVFFRQNDEWRLVALDRNDEIWTVRFSPCGNLIIFGDGDGKIGVWDWSANKLITEQFHGNHDYHVYAVDISSDGCFIASGSEDNTVRVWDIRGTD